MCVCVDKPHIPILHAQTPFFKPWDFVTYIMNYTANASELIILIVCNVFKLR